MTEIIRALVQQWPALAGLAVVAALFWTMFRRHMDENKHLLEHYRALSKDHVEEIERLRALFSGVLAENERMGSRYDEVRQEFSKILLENRALRRAVDTIEEMVRATGGDVKVISTQLQKAQEDIEEVSSKILLLDSKK